MNHSKTITRDRFDAALFDLDGVITDTARVHAACWKKLFDKFLEHWSESGNKSFQDFDINADYKLYVDGKLRYDGVRSFLQSRRIQLPHGNPDDPYNLDTICGLGNLKDQMFHEILDSDGVDVYKGSIDLVRHLRSRGLKTAVVSASKNCKAVLEVAGIAELFDLRMDGKVAERLNLAGKPEPDTYLKAAEQLGVEPGRAVVIEDAISGVQAGRNGCFGLVIGVDRKGDAETLRENGADIVIADLSELLRR